MQGRTKPGGESSSLGTGWRTEITAGASSPSSLLFVSRHLLRQLMHKNNKKKKVTRRPCPLSDKLLNMLSSRKMMLAREKSAGVAGNLPGSSPNECLSIISGSACRSHRLHAQAQISEQRGCQHRHGERRHDEKGNQLTAPQEQGFASITGKGLFTLL